MVAASLAPPAGLLGMAVMIGRIDMVSNLAFLLLLQLAGINLAASIVFLLYGLTSEGVRYPHGRFWVLPVGIASSLVILTGLVFWQLSGSPNLERSSTERRVEARVEELIRATKVADPIEVNARFTGAQTKGKQKLLIIVYAERKEEVPMRQDAIATMIEGRTRSIIREEGFQIAPVLLVTVLSTSHGDAS